MVIVGLLPEFAVGVIVCNSTFNMTASTGKVETELRKSKFSIFGKLAYLYRIDGHHVSTNIACELCGITHCALGDARHVAIDTCNKLSHYRGSLILSLLKMAIFAECAGRLHFGLAKLYHTGVWIMTVNALQC